MGRIRRGRILRDTSAGNGLVFVDGKQYPFRLEGMWKSEFAPKINMLVDVEFDDRGQPIALRTAPVQAAAAEQTTQAFNAAKASTRRLAQDVRADTAPALLQHAQALGYATLVALAALLLGWFYFSVASIDLGAGGRLATTFYQVLKLLNVRGIQDLIGGGGAGIYGLLCFLCVAGVLLPLVWRDRRANYALLAPLIFMVLIGLLARHKVVVQMNQLEQATTQFTTRAGALGDPRARQFASQFAGQMVQKARGSFSLDFGAWLSLVAGLYLAWRGIRKAQVDPDDDEPETLVERSVDLDQPAQRPAPPPRATGGRDYFDKGPERPASPSA